MHMCVAIGGSCCSDITIVMDVALTKLDKIYMAIVKSYIVHILVQTTRSSR
jgi:hypothetical protein